MNSKKLLSAILLSISLLAATGSMTSSAADLTIKDVNPESVEYSSVQWAVNQGYMSLTLGKFLPAKFVKRSEFASIVTKLTGNGKALLNPVKSTFQDVSTRNQFYKQIETARDYMTSYKINSTILFKPDIYLTREDAMFSIVKVLGYDSDEAFGSNENTDLSLDDVLEDANKINPALIKNVSVGVSYELMDLRTVEDKIYFDPKKNITRAELAELIYNAYQNKDYTAEDAIDESGSGNDPEDAEPVSPQNFTWKSYHFPNSNAIFVPTDGIRIKSITSRDPIKKGVENFFLVEVEYDLSSYESAIIRIGANDGIARMGGFFTDNIQLADASEEDKYYVKNQLEIKTGKGSSIFEISAAPAEWAYLDFQIQAIISIPSLTSGNIVGRDGVTIPVAKDSGLN
jgi:hypothetical protein